MVNLGGNVFQKSRPRIVVTRSIPDSALSLLRTHGSVWVSPHDRALTKSELLTAVSGADAIVAFLHDHIDLAVLEAAGPQLRCVSNVAAGFDNVDISAADSRGVIVTNTPGVLAEATADLTLGLILAVSRRIVEGDRLIRSGQSWEWHLGFMLGTQLTGKTIGLVGLGEIGLATARRARAFGMKVIYHARRRVNPDVEAELGGAQRVDLDTLFRTSDIVSLHCPLTPETHHLVNKSRLHMMRSTALLINTARGAIVDEEALVQALERRVIAGAALDVYEYEPSVHAGLTLLQNVVLAPHLGSATVETRTMMAQLAAANVKAVLADGLALTPVGKVRSPGRHAGSERPAVKQR